MGAILVVGCGGSSTAPVAPSAAATPTSTPVVTAPGPASSLPQSCRALPPATGTAAGCHQSASDFLGKVADAVSIAQNSTTVDPDTKETYAIVQDGQIIGPNAYLKLVIDLLDKQGLCAAYDGEEMNVRNSNGYNEQFDIITSSGGSWTKYMSTCSPATPIPVLPAPPNVDPECKLAPSKETYCDRLGSQYGGDVFAALDEVIAADQKLASPLIFDFASHAPGNPNGYRVANVPLYFSEMGKRMRARGYCNFYTGDDELWIKKGTNRLSEHWDLLTGEGYSLRLLSATCHDAAF